MCYPPAPGASRLAGFARAADGLREDPERHAYMPGANEKTFKLSITAAPDGFLRRI